MDAQHFDALTRRLTTSLSRRRTLGFLASLGLASFVAPDAAGAKKKCPPCKKRRNGKCKKKKPDGTSCPGGTCRRGVCLPGEPCPGQTLCNGECIPSNQCCTKADCPPIANYRCCNGVCTDTKLQTGNGCTQDSQCCSDYCQFSGSSNFTCAATCRGKGCTLAGGCCRGFTCLNLNSIGFGACGGCGDAVSFCTSDADCCFSACTAMPGSDTKQCISYAGQRCEKNADCRSCSANATAECFVPIDGTVQSICTNGVCGCPDGECCSDSMCLLGQFCERDDFGLNGVCKTPDAG